MMRLPAISPAAVPVSGPPGRTRGRAILDPLLAGSGRFLELVLGFSFPLFLIYVAVASAPAYAYAWDFHAFYQAGAAYLHLHLPYSAASLANLASQQNFVYPLPIAALFAPISLIPYWVAAILFIVASAFLLGAALRLLGVRDWRCYAIVLLGFPVQYGLKWGTISPLLAFLLALLWRYRDRRAVAVPALAFLVVSKLFLWPVALWFLFTRRYRTFLGATACAVAACLLAAVPFGFGVFPTYVHLLRAVSNFEAPQSFSMYALGVGLGLSTVEATIVAISVGALVLVAAFRWSRTDQSRAFRALVLAALLLSPIVWEHYLVLLAVPLALTRPRFSPAWFALSWVTFDGFVLGHNGLMFETAAVILLSVVQAGIVPMPRRLAFEGLRSRLRVSASTAMVLVWIPFTVIVMSATGILPLSAALYPPKASSSNTGAAFVRLAMSGQRICWRVWTDLHQPGLEAQLVNISSGAVLARHALATNPRNELCMPLGQGVGAPLVSHFERASGGYELFVRSATGRTLLRGVIVRRVDAGLSIAQGGRAQG